MYGVFSSENPRVSTERDSVSEIFTSLITKGTRNALYRIFGLSMLPAPRVFIASLTLFISAPRTGGKDEAISIPSVTPRGTLKAERLLVISAGSTLIPSAAARNTEAKRLNIATAVLISFP